MSARARDMELSPAIVTGVLRAADLAVVVMAAVIANLVRFGTAIPNGDYLLVVVVAMLVTANVFQGFRLYEFPGLTGGLSQARKIFVGWSLVVLLVLGLGFLAKTAGGYSRIWFSVWYFGALTGLFTLRFALRTQLFRWQHQGRLVRKVAVIGAGEQGQRLVRHLIADRDRGLELIGVFDDRETRVPADVDGLTVLGTVDDLLALTRLQRIDLIIVALPWRAEERLLQVMRKLKTVPTDVRLCPEGVAYQFHRHGVSHVGGISMLNIFERPLSNWNRVIKAFEDRVLAATILLLISPLLLVIAALIKVTSPGPVLYRQKRFGFNNEVIAVWKFRTMYHGRPESQSVPQATRGDPRVTPLGAFLRHTSLDELPQFINVVQGDMSIVGPRPHAVAHNEKFATMLDQYLARHNVKPGITGWAQINGYRGEIRTDEDLQKRVQHDLYYIDNWSLLFDFRIIMLTILRGFVHENAY